VAAGARQARSGFFSKLKPGRINNKAVLAIAVLLLLGCWTLRLTASHYNGYHLAYAGHSYYNSDDVAQANVLWQWQEGDREGAVVGDNNWSLKYPLYYFTNNLNVSPLKRLYVNSFVVLALAAVLLMTAVYRFASVLTRDNFRQRTAIISAALLLAAVPAQAFGVLKSPNSRNIELGIFLLLMFALYCYEHRPDTFVTQSKLKLTAILIITGFLCMEDPLFIYFGLVPLAIVTGVYYFLGRIEWKKTVEIILFAVGALVVSVFMKGLLALVLPVRFLPHESNIVSFNEFLSAASALIGHGVDILGINIFGQDPKQVSTLLIGCMLLIVTISVWAIFNRSRLNRKSVFDAFMAFLWVWVLLVYLASDLSAGGAIGNRYLIILVALLPLGIVMAVTSARRQRQVWAIVVLSSLVFAFTFGLEIKDFAKGHTQPNTFEYSIIDNLKKEGLTAGYARFWMAGITSYLSNQETTVLPVKCYGGRLALSDQFFDHGVLRHEEASTFYLYDPTHSQTADCSPDALRPQLGRPAKTEVINSDGLELVIYDYDIGSKMQIKSAEL
jgi:hypothetical protein